MSVLLNVDIPIQYQPLFVPLGVLLVVIAAWGINKMKTHESLAPEVDFLTLCGFGVSGLGFIVVGFVGLISLAYSR